jgi:gliding motility-associated-like protein
MFRRNNFPPKLTLMVRVVFCNVFIFFVGIFPTMASHIVGGDIAMQYIGKQGLSSRFKITLSLFFDDVNARPDIVADFSDYLNAGIFRKGDNAVMLRPIRLNAQGKQQVAYTNEACALANNLKTSKYTFVGEVVLDPGVYDSPQGYYLVWSDCCRNYVTTNIISTGLSQTGQTFYMEFPPVNTYPDNSSPKFNFPNGEIICTNQDFSFDFGATDADGDRREYSFITPYSGRGSGTDRKTAPIAIIGNDYPKADWTPGYSLSNIIPGNPAMKIDPATGLMTVRATEKGQAYVVTVECKEFKGTKQIGVVRRDFQFKVEDCLPPPPTPLIVDKPTSTTQLLAVDFCDTGYIEIQTRFDANYNYQWQLEGVNIQGGTENKLKVRQTGDYTVNISYISGCSGQNSSQLTKVSKIVGEPYKLLTPKGIKACQDVSPLPLISPLQGVKYSYVWKKDGFLIPTTTFQHDAIINGRYSVVVNNSLSSCFYEDSVDVVINSLPLAQISSVGNLTEICADDTLKLSTPTGVGYTYEWLKDNVTFKNTPDNKLILTKDVETAVYTVRVKDGNTCQRLSLPLSFKIKPVETVQYNALPPICGNFGATINLVNYVTPTGGVFSGTGVNGNGVFEAGKVGFGKWKTTYTYTNSVGCPTRKIQEVYVGEVPRITLGPDFSIFAGDTVTLKSDLPPGNLVLLWTSNPGTGYISNTAVARPVIAPLQETKYTLNASFGAGTCANKNEITVFVNAKIKIPNAFTPNNDGFNNVWEIDGLDSINYPDNEVMIYNRWGNEVFYTKNYSPTNAFTGTKDGKSMAEGTYYYVIKTNRKPLLPLTGYVTIIR